jgi:hypothetical protein
MEYRMILAPHQCGYGINGSIGFKIRMNRNEMTLNYLEKQRTAASVPGRHAGVWFAPMGLPGKFDLCQCAPPPIGLESHP